MINIKRLFFILAFFACFFASEQSNAQKKINRYDENGKRTGVWKKYYPNKRVRYTGKFENGKEVGVFKFYDITETKHPTIIKTFFYESDSLFVQYYTLKGSIKTEGVLNRKKRVGNWKYYYPSGVLMAEENYVDGVLDGEQIVYYPDSYVTEFAVYKMGLIHGVTRKYASDGTLIEEVYYENGKENGPAKYFELNGKLKEQGVYKDGRRVGKWEYYLDGELAPEEANKKKKFTKKKFIKKEDN